MTNATIFTAVPMIGQTQGLRLDTVWLLRRTWRDLFCLHSNHGTPCSWTKQNNLSGFLANWILVKIIWFKQLLVWIKFTRKQARKPRTWNYATLKLWPTEWLTSPVRYPNWFNTMFEFCSKLIQFNIWFKIISWKFNSKDYSIQNQLLRFNSINYSI